MAKTILLALACGVAGAAVPPLIGTTIYSSVFQCSYPIGSAFKTVVDPANVWSWTGDIPPGGTSVLVDFDGDGQMDTNNPFVRVLITDMLNFSGGEVDIVDSSGLRWRMGPGVGQHHNLTTPIVLPVGSTLTLTNTLPATLRSTLIGRVVNL
jgi:archaellin